MFVFFYVAILGPLELLQLCLAPQKVMQFCFLPAVFSYANAQYFCLLQI